MKRRDFFKNATIVGTALSTTGVLLSSCSSISNLPDLHRVEKVKMAMLSMQRATWEQGVAMQALLEAGEKDLIITMAKDAVLRQIKDGRVAMCGQPDAGTDAASPGEAILWAANQTGEERLLEGHRKLLKYMMTDIPRNDEGIIYHFIGGTQFWSDSNYMLPPYLAVSGEYNEALKQIFGWKKYLWSEEHHLLSHMWHDGEKRLNREAFWGVGNGWAAAGFARVIAVLPDSMLEEKNQLIKYATQLIDGCIKYLRPDGLFHDVLDDSSTFIETNLSQQLAYTIFKGIKVGWLDEKYLESANKMRSATILKVDDLGLIQGVCGAPFFNAPGIATEGQAFHILMEVAYNELINEHYKNK